MSFKLIAIDTYFVDSFIFFYISSYSVSLILHFYILLLFYFLYIYFILYLYTPYIRFLYLFPTYVISIFLIASVPILQDFLHKLVSTWLRHVPWPAGTDVHIP